MLDRLRIPVLRCGAVMRPRGEAEAAAVAALARNAAENGVEVQQRDDGSLEVPGEAVTDPVAYTQALRAAASAAGAEIRTGAPVTGDRPG